MDDLRNSMSDEAKTHEKQRKLNGGFWLGGSPSTWTSTGRRVRLPDGTERVLFASPAMPGDLRVRKMVRKKGRLVATYVA